MSQRPRKVKWVLPKGATQFGALIVILLIDSLVAPHFFSIHIQDGRLFGSVIDILNRGAPVALLALGMTLVIATGGIDLSVGAVMARLSTTAPFRHRCQGPDRSLTRQRKAPSAV